MNKDIQELEAFTGGIQSPVDYRDIPLSAVGTGVSLPSKYFNDVSSLPVWWQHKIGACVGHAGAKYKQRLDQIETGTVIPLSARFLYAIAKCRDGYSAEGTYPRLVASILTNVGCATENTIPNDTLLDHESYVYQRKESNIPKAAYDEALQYRAGGYAFPDVKSPDSLKDAIVNHNGAMLLVRLGREWYTSKKGVTSWAAKDVLPLRAPEKVISGHEVYLYGYEDVVEKGVTRTKFYIFNSWSSKWGNKGTGWFYYDEYANFLTEAITLTDVPNTVKQQLTQLPTAETFKYKFTKDLKRGDNGPDVVALQTALMIDGEFDKTMYGELLVKNELGWFGSSTADALYKYQQKYSIASQAELYKIRYIHGGIVGPKTRNHLNSWTNK